MEKDLIILKDGAELELESASSLGDIRILFADKNSLLAAWEKMTPENLQEVRIQNRSGIVAARYTDMVLGDPVLTVHRQGQEGFLAAFGSVSSRIWNGWRSVWLLWKKRQMC